MTKDKRTFSVEVADVKNIDKRSHSIEIFLDKQELNEFIDRLQMLHDRDAVDHLHFMSDSWGLGDLTEATHRQENLLTHHLKIYLVDEQD